MYYYFLIGAFLLFGVGASYQYWMITSAIEKSKTLIAKAVAYEQHPSSPTMRILVAGDSTGVGVGAIANESIAGRLGQQFPNADITNISNSGYTLIELNRRLDDLGTDRVKVVVLQIGANDITSFTPLSLVRAEIARSLATSVQRADIVIVLTAGNVGASPVFYWPISSLVERRTQRVREIFMQETAVYPQAHYIDLFKDRAHEPFNKDIERYYAPDKFHPSGEGYGLWYEEIKSQAPSLF